MFFQLLYIKCGNHKQNIYRNWPREIRIARKGARGVIDIGNAIHTVIIIYTLFSSPNAIFALIEQVLGHVNYSISQRTLLMKTIL